MDPRIAPYAAQNPDLNCTYAQVQKLEAQLSKLGIGVTSAQATTPNAAPITYTQATTQGLQPGDALFWQIQIFGQLDPAQWFDVAQLATDIAPANFNAVWKIMSDLFPQSGNAQALAYAALTNIPGVNVAIGQALAA